MQAVPAVISASDLKRMRELVRTFFDKKTYNLDLKYKILYARAQKNRVRYTLLWLAAAVMLIGLGIYLGLPFIPWLLAAGLVSVLLLYFFYPLPSAPKPSREQFQDSYDKLVAWEKARLVARAREGLRIEKLDHENFPLWGIWGVFGEHRQGVLPEPDVLKDAVACKDGILRCTPLSLTAFAFEDQRMYVFQAAADITIGNIIYESVREIAYSDVVGVSHHKSTKEFRLAELKDATREELAQCGLLGGLRARAINGIIAADDNDFFEIALSSGEKVHAVFRDVDLMPEESFEYRYGENSAACEIADETFRPGGVPSRRDLLRNLTDRVGIKKTEAARTAKTPQ